MTATDPDLHVCPECGSINQCDRDIEAEVAPDLLAQIEKALDDASRDDNEATMIDPAEIYEVLAAIRSAAPVEPT